jgi:N-acetylmuramoyl-L-alanine amidase
MPENRFLRLEQNICRRSSLANVHSTTPPEEFWMGTIDRLPPVEIQPMESSNRVVSDAMSARGDWSIQSWDDGWPIELHYDSKSLRSQNGVMPATPTQLAAPAKPNGMRGNTPQSGGNAQPTAAVPLSPLVGVTSEGLESDEEFATQIRSMLSNTSSITAARPDSPPLGDTNPAAPTQNPFTPPTSSAASTETPSQNTESEVTRYQVFDQLQQNLYPARGFDLGTVSVEAAFDAIEKAMDREEQSPNNGAKPPSSSAPPPLNQMDIVEDLSLMAINGEQIPSHRAMASSATWRDYTPTTTNTLVIDGAEFPAPGGISWKNWSAPSVSQFRGKPQQITRTKSDVIQLVIHETVGSMWQGLSGPNLGVQFHLDRDGSMVQHNDAVDKLWHVRTFAGRSAGIEVVNLVFDNDNQPNPGEKEPGVRIKVPWSAKNGGFYVIPPQVQMESLAITVRELMSQFSIPDQWLQVIPHPDAVKASGVMAGRWFFIMSTGGHLYFRNMVNEPGIASHSVLIDHADGAFPTLYTWLRLHKGMTSDNAYQMAIQIAEDPGGFRYQTHFDSSTSATLQLLDVTDVI